MGVEDWIVRDMRDSLPGSFLLDLLDQHFRPWSILLGSHEESPPTFVSVAPSDLHRHLGDLLKTEKGADVVFEVGGHTFAAHRCVLAARSPVFSACLSFLGSLANLRAFLDSDGFNHLRRSCPSVANNLVVMSGLC